MASNVARPARPWDLSEPEERDWFGVLGEGLAVMWPAQADREWPRAGGAWLHIAPSGVVTAFTGKVGTGLTAEKSAAVCGLTGRRLSYGTLVAGTRRAEVSIPN